jgi:hypothetical protein
MAEQAISRAVRLEDYVRRCNQRAFHWSRNNCCHFAAGWVEEVLGIDTMAGLPPTHDARAARQLLRSLASGDLREAVSQRLGVRPMRAELAATGDVVMLETSAGIGYALGICSGMHFFAPSHSIGLISLPMREAVCAWKIEP